MKQEIIFNEDLHFEHENWNRQLNFWEDELRTFHNRLEELVMRWTDESVLTQIEKFQNKFLIQENTIDSVKNQIEMHETNMSEHYKINEDVLNKTLVDIHMTIREQMDSQREIYDNLKKDFFTFLTKYM